VLAQCERNSTDRFMAKAHVAPPVLPKASLPQLAELASLYRSIGISSVASAVAAQKMMPSKAQVVHELPPLLRKDRAFD
jgi:hypothetical protein